MINSFHLVIIIINNNDNNNVIFLKKFCRQALFHRCDVKRFEGRNLEELPLVHEDCDYFNLDHRYTIQPSTPSHCARTVCYP